MRAADGKNEIRQKVEDVIPGLPDDIALECLVRVPYRFHSTMKWVCRGWRTLIAHPSFYRERRRLRTAEHLVCLVQALPSPLPPPSPPPPPPPPPPRDSTTDDCTNNITINTAKEVEEELHHHHHHHPLYDGQDDAEDKRQLHCPPPLYGLSIYNASRHTWHRMMPNCGFGSSGIPMFCHCVALPSCGKLLLLGGWDPTSLEALPDVYVLDFMGGGFRRAASMSVGRSFFACAAVGPSTVYVGGGHDNQKNALRSAEVYDADADEWRTLPAMAVERDECQGLCWEGDPDGRFWVVSGYSTESQGRFRSDAECYDPATGCWSRVDGVWPFPSMSPRGTTASSVGYEWWWFLEGEQQQQNIISGDALQIRGENNDEWRSKEKNGWKVVNHTILLPDGMNIGSSPPCVTALGGGGGGGGGGDRIFVMGGRSRRRGSSSSIGGGGGGEVSSCGECDGEGAMVMERDSKGDKYKWNHIHTPLNFTGFPYSASYLLV